jgi:hypothetical protein
MQSRCNPIWEAIHFISFNFILMEKIHTLEAEMLQGRNSYEYCFQYMKVLSIQKGFFESRVVIPNYSILYYSITRNIFFKDPGYPGDSNSSFLNVYSGCCLLWSLWARSKLIIVSKLHRMLTLSNDCKLFSITKTWI